MQSVIMELVEGLQSYRSRVFAAKIQKMNKQENKRKRNEGGEQREIAEELYALLGHLILILLLNHYS